MIKPACAGKTYSDPIYRIVFCRLGLREFTGSLSTKPKVFFSLKLCVYIPSAKVYILFFSLLASKVKDHTSKIC